MEDKFIIAVCGFETTGKTCTVRNVWEMLPASHESKKISLNDNLRHEVWGYVEHDADEKGFYPVRHKTGVASRGDTSEEIREWVIPLIEVYHCDIIVCACHSCGDDTLQTVETIASYHGYKLITFGNFSLHIPLSDRESLRKKLAAGKSPVVEAGGVNLSRLSAKSIVELIEAIR